jgi:SAM-dependent methyltransferase
MSVPRIRPARALAASSTAGPADQGRQNRPSAGIYESERLAEAYAFARPPVHQAIVAASVRRLAGPVTVGRMLDIGCGAGLSTAAVAPLARTTVGLEPALAMLRHRRRVAPGAHFVAARAERLPFAGAAFDVLTAAGALNYVDPAAFYPEVDRVLRPGGRLLVYDFSEGRRARGHERLAAWFAEFEHRYPPPPGYALDIERFDFSVFGFRLEVYEALEVMLPMTLATYVPYVLSEAGVETAVAGGTNEAEVRAWCESTLAGVFEDHALDVLFDAYVAAIGRVPHE